MMYKKLEQSLKLLCVFYVLFVAINCFAGPRITCAKKVFDFGTMHDGQTAEHTYTIKNSGDVVLNIGKIRACCGSTAVISSTTIEPGKTAELVAKLPLGNRYGKQDKNIFIASDDPKMPYLQLKFIGEVKRRVVIEPRTVRFNDLKLGQNAEQFVEITSTLPMNIIKIESSSKAFIALRDTEKTLLTTEPQSGNSNVATPPDQTDKSISLSAKENTENAKQLLTTDRTDQTDEMNSLLSIKKKTSMSSVHSVAKIKVSTVADKLVKGLNRGTVTLHTDNKDYPRIRIFCRAQVEDSIKVTPSEIVLKKSSKSVTRYVAVRADKPFKVQDVKTPESDIKVSYKPRGKDAYLFVISNIPSDELLNSKSVVIKTDYDNGREIEIPFSVKN